MIDLIEYIVAELKSKRISRAHATSLLKQLSMHRPLGIANWLHPLLHENTSDLLEQRYSSIFSGKEFFLADHKVQSAKGKPQPVLPAVAYLEMARAAVENATPRTSDSDQLELFDVAWAQPIVVTEETTVHLSVMPADSINRQSLDFEIYTSREQQDVVHCQGRATWRPATELPSLNLAALRIRMNGPTLSPAQLYVRFRSVGLVYGEGFRAVEALSCGYNELLATLRLPATTAAQSMECVLPPALLDGAIQSAVGLLSDSGSTELRLPFALERLLVLRPCVTEMLAWVRFAEGSDAQDAIGKVDVDLCDTNGRICVQIHGFCSRVKAGLVKSVGPTAARVLLASPEWIQHDLATKLESGHLALSASEKHIVLLCGMPAISNVVLQTLLPNSHSEVIVGCENSSLAERYTEYAVESFQRLRTLLLKWPDQPLYVQLLGPGGEDEEVFAGLSGLLRTAALENPQVSGTVILLDGFFTPEQLCHLLTEEAKARSEMVVRYVCSSSTDEPARRQALVWKEVASPDQEPEPSARKLFCDESTYVITGGLGGLGLLFAREILERTSTAMVVATGRSVLTPAKTALLQSLPDHGRRVVYRQLDFVDLTSVESSMDAIRADFGPISGLLHSAGMVTTNYIVRKNSDEFRQVLQPKVTHLEWLDWATRHDPLKFFCMFSSLGALGNMGMADYAAGNAFMDHFSAVRNRHVAQGLRHGVSRSINWPLWAEGGMGFDAAMQQVVGRSIDRDNAADDTAMGTFYHMVSKIAHHLQLAPLRTSEGMSAFYRGLSLPHDQFAVLAGNVTDVRGALSSALNNYPKTTLPDPTPRTIQPPNDLGDKTQSYLRRQLSSVLKMAVANIDTGAPLEDYGMDSILAMRVTNELEKDLGSLSKTLFFEYRTLDELSAHLLERKRDALTRLLGEPIALQSFQALISLPPTKGLRHEPYRKGTKPLRHSSAMPAPASDLREPIAIIGLSGRYPEARDISAFWQNLRDGKDCITEVPSGRWDWREFLSEDRTQEGCHFSKWGGFIEGVDEFDPLFFNVSPTDAVLIDPQERLFLQHAWMAMEDAGYTRARLQPTTGSGLSNDVGVYAGLMYSEYQLFGAEISLQQRPLGVAGSAASVANRVSYTLNLHGPSMTVDTMCSASLTAIHLACQDLRLGRIGAAFAGGVNLSIHPNKYLCLSAGQFISSDGHCQSFGVGGDGYIPGEGVGVVLLKRLSDAERDGDHIYGLVRGSAMNHGGRTNGYSVPNPQAQASAVRQALLDAQVEPWQISYIEAHGTGTRLGDPIEIAGLERAFDAGSETPHCLIGSVKSNIGHCESAAGIAGLTKVLLQMQYGEIVPSLHSTALNPYIDFDRSSFEVNQTLCPWHTPVHKGHAITRIAGISSFGAGGSNAHLIVEDYKVPATDIEQTTGTNTVAIVLSARTTSQLEQKAADLLAFIKGAAQDISLSRLAFTLQQGREPMEERLGFTATSLPEVERMLQAFLAPEGIDNLFRGQKRRGDDALSLFNVDADLKQMLAKWLQENRFSRLLELWVKGVELDWDRVYPSGPPQRMSLPTYPFSRDRFWLDTRHIRRGSTNAGASALLHPLLHRNVSDLRTQCFASTFTGQEPFLADHRWRSAALGQTDRSATRVMPAAALLEMVRAAVELSLPSESDNEVLSFRDVVWLNPLEVTETAEVRVSLSAAEDGEVLYRVEQIKELPALLICEGYAAWTLGPITSPQICLADSRSLIAKDVGLLILQGNELYDRFQTIGLIYGPSHRAIQTVTIGGGLVLSHLRLSTDQASAQYGLPPALLDGALQTCAMLVGSFLTDSLTSTFVPAGVKRLVILRPCQTEMFAVASSTKGAVEGDTSYTADIDMCDLDGNVCVEIRGFLVRSLPQTSQRAISSVYSAPTASGMGLLFGVPAWQAKPLDLTAQGKGFGEWHVLICGLAQLSIEQLNFALSGACRVTRAGNTSLELCESYMTCALECFEQLKALAIRQAKEIVLVQVVVANDPDGLILTSLTALLQTAMLEEPFLRTQMIAVSEAVTAYALKLILVAEASGPLDTLVRYDADQREILYWREVEDRQDEAPPAFRNDGVYVVTGGLGGLGTLFAQDLLQRTDRARVVLTGRFPLSEEKILLLEQWPEAARVRYHSVNLGVRAEVDALIAQIIEEHGRLDGIFHSAGMISDSLLRNKNSEQFLEVLKPKVAGTINLDAASANVSLDFFVFFSSVAAVMGNPGQADYATANAFMDRFAEFRNLKVSAGLRRGVTRSINWPLWESGGMTMSEKTREQLFRTTGMAPLQTKNGLLALNRSLRGSDAQMMVVEGDLARMRGALTKTLPVPDRANVSNPASIPASLKSDRQTDLLRVAEDHLREQVAELFRIPPERIRPEIPFEEYGIDSILVVKLTARLEQTFGVLSKTLLFEHQTVGALTSFLVKVHDVTLERIRGGGHSVDAGHEGETESPKVAPLAATRPDLRQLMSSKRRDERQDIAIIGMAGRYPQADDLAAFWTNLRSGRDSITGIPSDRWDHAPYFSADRRQPGKTYSRWGGFLDDVDRFDARFFSISPKEAELIDPQERLFLQTAWHTFEDAGYRKDQIAGKNVGVYVGVMWSHYELLGADVSGPDISGIPSSSHASIANRVSYFLNLKGPSLALDTMCSSSLTAIHLACDALRRGTVEVALAGGVNLTLHPYKYLSLSQGQFMASDGRCRTFGDGGDGYVPGEGVGAVLLKPLSQALRDGDRIHALIRGSSINHGGKTNGYTVPNPVAQGELIRDALRQSDVDPGTIGYIEAHGTGTALGDPIEMTGLIMGLENRRKGTPPCAVGSVKSNIGHLEAAAGIAAVSKAVLQLTHRELVPSLHAETLNSNIDWERAPIRVQTQLTAWPTVHGHPRRAGVSSFGAGGSNAHLILEEFCPSSEPAKEFNPNTARDQSPQLIVMSALNPETLVRYAESWQRLCMQPDNPSLANMAYTSQIGRTALPVRLGILARDCGQLNERLGRWLDLTRVNNSAHANALDDTFSGDCRRETPYVPLPSQELLQSMLASGDLSKLAGAWVSGVDLEWAKLLQTEPRHRVAIPLYPFARERHWLSPSWGVASQKLAAVRTSHVPETERELGSLATGDPRALLTATLLHLKRVVGEEIRLDPDRIDPEERLELLGLESIALQNINSVLASDLGELPQTLFYERGTLAEVAHFLIAERQPALIRFFGKLSIFPVAENSTAETSTRTKEESELTRRKEEAETIAIVGMHGAFSQATDLGMYWDHLRAGNDLVGLVPSNRWDAEALFDSDPDAASQGKIYCKWGGFMDGVDEFDASFFRISREEACSMDPQERIFLQSVWAALEDAGLTREQLKVLYPSGRSTSVGVFVGVTTNTYQLCAAEERGQGRVAAASSLPWSIANRVSYFFDFNGPSIPVDTACSSSLVAVHLACESLRKGECGVSIAGGVNLYLHPAKYQQLCARNMLARHGRCRSYGAGDDGFVPGEGVGTLVLKRLSDAVRDGDRIHAVISGSGYEHAGRAHGYSAPNPSAQTRLIRRVIHDAGVAPSSISYVEGHGTGTQIGDSLEVAALTEALRTEPGTQKWCALGSVKTNVGHTESAAGIAGIAKVVLQIKHKELVPSLHAPDLNPGIDFERTPFTLQQVLAPWLPSDGKARRALINAFGAGGVNACVLIEEYRRPDQEPPPKQDTPNIVLLSARSDASLRTSAKRLLSYVRHHPETSWSSLCFTLQTGRESMEERLAIPTTGISDLIEQLEGWLHGRPAQGLLRGSVARHFAQVDLEQDISQLSALGTRWVRGEGIDWNVLYKSRPLLASLPTYPFEKQSYWFSSSVTDVSHEFMQTTLHPLVSYNSSTLREISFTSLLSERCYLGSDHKLNATSVMPGAAFLEIACLTGTIAGEDRVLGLRDIVWIQPLIFHNGPALVRTTLQLSGSEVDFVISTLDENGETTIHSEGSLFFREREYSVKRPRTAMTLAERLSRCTDSQSGERFYKEFARRGFAYGPAFQPICEIHFGPGFALARMELPQTLADDFDQYLLHPSLIDGALQTAAGLLAGGEQSTPHVPFALDEIRLHRPLPRRCYALAVLAEATDQDVSTMYKFNLQVLSENGETLVDITNLFVRALDISVENSKREQVSPAHSLVGAMEKEN